MTKMRVRILPYLMAGAIAFSAIPSGTVLASGTETEDAIDVSWYRTGDSSFSLTTPEQLAGLAAIVNGTVSEIAQDSFEGKTVYLDRDIDLSDRDWTPIGTAEVKITDSGAVYTLGKAFSGTFDGNSHKISGLSCTDENGDAALFGYSTGTLEHFVLSGDVEGNYYTAGVAAFASGTITDVVNQAKVVAEGNCVGGIVGFVSDDIVITDCHNMAVVTNNGVPSEKSTGRVGGIVGCVDTGVKADITFCSNTADITGYQYTAGIIGGSFGDVSVDGCYNSGNIQCVSFGKAYLGSIAGKLENGTISNCYNTGNLYDSHWSQGHIRAVGGIAGCEEDHSEGTAIRNCYTTGEITFNTSNMIYGTNYIYMTGNISGGNSTTGENTMHYSNCFYLQGRIAIADPEHPDYRLWSDVYKNNVLAYDTADITSVTQEQLSGADISQINVPEALGEYFTEDTQGINQGYPILCWQADKEMPEIEYTITGQINGGTAVLTGLPQKAKKGDTVTFSVTETEAGKQVRSVTVKDMSGSVLQAEKTTESQYIFVMPAQNVTVTVDLENAVAEENEYYAVTLPENLDGIWSVQTESTYMDSETGKIREGATVTVTVKKESAAITTDFSGISVNQGTVPVTEIATKSSQGARYYGEYRFVMPKEDVTIALDGISYSELKVLVQDGDTQTVINTLSREDMQALGAENGTGYYSGWETEKVSFIGKAESYVTIRQLLKNSGLELNKEDTLMVRAVDGMNLIFSYDYLYGSERYCYNDIFNGSKENRTLAEPMLVIKGNMLLSTDQGSLSDLNCDTMSTYRFVFGQTEDEYENHTKVVDKQPRSICEITVIRGEKEEQLPVEAMWIRDENGWRYRCSDNTWLTGCWKLLGNKWYHFNDSGYMEYGWQKINGKWYYLGGADDGVMKNSWQYISGKWYYLGGPDDGAMKSGWQKINGKWYYLGGSGDGAMKSGWQEINGKWYYLGGSGDGSMKSGWQYISGKWYYLGGPDDGSMKTGWQYIGGKWYCFASDGAWIK